MNAEPLSRAQRLLRYLAAHPEGANVRQVRDGVDGSTSIATVSAQLGQFVVAGKARRTGAAGHTTYFPTKLTLVDKRRRTTQAKPAPKPQRSKPAAQAPRKAREPVNPPPPPADSHLRVPITRHTTAARGIALTSEQIAADIAAFRKRGGRIQKLKPGESSSPLFESVRDLNAKAMRKRLAEADNDPDTDLDDADDIAAIAHA